jgi:hypothetical protein
VIQISASSVSGAAVNAWLPDVPVCPICHHAVEPVVWGTALWAEVSLPNVTGSQPASLQVVLRCPRAACRRLYIVRLRHETAGGNPSALDYWDLVDIAPRKHTPKEFPEEVRQVSGRFVEIYDQASAAEDSGLDQICGPAYRKALEFLIKDFLKSRSADEPMRTNIEQTQLAGCIAKYVDDSRLKAAASRAAWLGNDETHYVRRWENKDLNDLKKLIDLTAYWVSAEILTAELAVSMPDPKAAAKGD